MNLALFFEGTGQGVHGQRTNVSLVFEACRPEGQKLHLEAGPGTHAWYRLRGHLAGRDWCKIFSSARRWFESVHARDDSVFLFGFSRGALLARHFAAWLDKLGVEVRYLGLWDTVDATPGLEVSTDCPPNVRFARHAVAEHEARRFYAYVPLVGRQVEERLFPGVHCDVGGLYEDDHELADVARAWVARPARDHGLAFVRPEAFDERPASPTARCHDSLRLVSNLFGLISPVKRVFPPELQRAR